MNLFSSVFSGEVAAIFLMTFSFVVDGNLNPISIGLFDSAERSLSQGNAHARVAPGNKSGPSESEETQTTISQTKFSLTSVDVAQIELRQFTRGSATKTLLRSWIQSPLLLMGSPQVATLSKLIWLEINSQSILPTPSVSTNRLGTVCTYQQRHQIQLAEKLQSKFGLLHPLGIGQDHRNDLAMNVNYLMVIS